MRYMEIYKMTGFTVGFSKTLFSASTFFDNYFNFHVETLCSSTSCNWAYAGIFMCKNGTHEMEEDAQKRRAPLPGDGHGNTTIVACLE